MISIDLEENKDDSGVVDDNLTKPKEVGINFKFKKNLIFQVRKYRLLYDHRHKNFSNIAKRDLVWQQIAKQLKSTVSDCEDTWYEMRYAYQRHARRLRNYFIIGNKGNHKRPAMYLESELTFLWRFVENRKTCKTPFDINENENVENDLIIIETEPEKTLDPVANVTNSDAIEKETECNKMDHNDTNKKPEDDDLILVEKETDKIDQNDANKKPEDDDLILVEKETECNKIDQNDANKKPVDDDLILVEQPVELIVIDEDDEKQFKLNAGMKMLISQVKNYPEIYDSAHLSYRDYTRKSSIWNSIASNMGDKATKLMKCWIIMETRYEWEISQPKSKADSHPASSELQVQLEFMKTFILKNSDTVYKQSYYLKKSWFDPIDYFKDIYNLIVRMKKKSEIVCLTDSLLKMPEKNSEYISLWTGIASLKGTTAGQCEITWLIMRQFYWELMCMRQENYQLTDKWYFETIITELYAISKTTYANKQQEQQVLQKNKTKNVQKRPAETNATSMGAPAAARPCITPTTMQMTPTIINNLQNVPANFNSTFTTPSAGGGQTSTFPKITAAISLAPQSLNTGTLQIKQISGPPTLSPAPPPLSMPNFMPTSTPRPNATTLPTQMSMSFNLPSQTKVTSITMPPALRPLAPPIIQPQVVRNTPSHAMISVRPQSFLRPALPQIQPAPWCSIPSSNINSIVQPQQVSPSLQKVPNTEGINMSNIYPPTVTIPLPIPTTTANPPSIAAYKSIAPPKNITTSLINPVLSNNGPTATPTTFTNSNTSTIPPLASFKNANTSGMTTPPYYKNVNATTMAAPTPFSNANTSTMATSTLSTSVTTSTRSTPSSSTLTTANNTSPLPKITGAISLLNPNEILIELISSNNGNQLMVHGPALTTKYQLSMPTVAKFIREVMAIPLLHNKNNNQPIMINYYWEHIGGRFNLPVHICRACWNFLLENFNHFPQIAPMKELMKPFNIMLNVWKRTNAYFKKFDDQCIAKGWLQYVQILPDVIETIGGYPLLYKDVAKSNGSEELSDMETLCAWRTISLRFPRIPEIEEIWAAFKKAFCQYMSDIEFGIINQWPTNWWRSLARMKFLVEAKYSTNEPFYYIISNKMVEEIEVFAMLELKMRYKTEVTEPTIQESEKYISDSEVDVKMVPLLYTKKEVELGALMTAIQKYPQIYGKGDHIDKYQAWKKVAQELSMEVIDCLLAFKNATKMYFTYKKQDVKIRCRLHEKYYKKLDEIVRSLMANKGSTSRNKINIKTPFELNQSLDDTNDSADLIFPERYISDISMSNSPSNLVVKNWVYAIGNVPLSTDYGINKLNEILKKYLSNVK